MKLQFKCTLLSDLIINQSTGTEGAQSTLDFIPGSNFLGIVAGALYDQLSSEQQQLIFHSGKVRFGDAHPAAGDFRTLRIPASMHYPKGNKISDPGSCYIYHLYDREKDLKEKEEKGETAPQLKQCRTGFYRFVNNEAEEVKIGKAFAIKSAYDRESRRSKDSQMYGYESIQEGSVYYFEVEIPDTPSCEIKPGESLDQAIQTALKGTKRIGRSRTAQYGQVKIEPCKYTEVTSSASAGLKEDGTMDIYIYADGRLIFLDENGNPTFQPDVKQLLGQTFQGSAEILWNKSQIRTFQYAPWNFKRQARDTDRCGIEKGSVFVIQIKDKTTGLHVIPSYVGSYKNEGFGKILMNPEFLVAKEDTNGMALYEFKEKSIGNTSSVTPEEPHSPLTAEDQILFDYLKGIYQEQEDEKEIYKLVNGFIDDAGGRFRTDSFASQWGYIRNLAIQNGIYEDLHLALFAKGQGYLDKGVAKEKWDKEGRRDLLEKFYGSLQGKKIAQQVIINLAATMGKICGRNQKRDGN